MLATPKRRRVRRRPSSPRHMSRRNNVSFGCFCPKVCFSITVVHLPSRVYGLLPRDHSPVSPRDVDGEAEAAEINPRLRNWGSEVAEIHPRRDRHMGL